MSRLFKTRREHGAVIPLVALLLPVIMIMTAFAVDLGSQRSLRRTLQADADVIALDLVRLADGRTTAEIEGASDAVQATVYRDYVNQSLTNNGVDPVTTVGELAGMVTFGTWEDGRSPEEFVATAPTDAPNAVEVTLEGTQDYRFAPGSGSATRRAVATTDGLAVFSVGSRLASLSTDDSALLNPILSALFDPPALVPAGAGMAVPFTFSGASASASAPAEETTAPAPAGGVTLDALSYTGLANADVVLNDILGFAFADVAAVNADVATTEDVLVSDIALLTLVEASADALAASGEGAEVTAAVSYLRGLAVNIDPTLKVNVGKLLGLDLSQPGAVLGARINLLDLLFTSAQLANATNLVDFNMSLPPGLFSSLPGFRNVVDPQASLSLTVVEGPQIGTGRPKDDPKAFAETSQIDLDMKVGLQLSIDLGGLDWTGLLPERELASVSLALPVRIDVAKARSTLTELLCTTDGSPATMDLPTITKSAGVVIGAGQIATIEVAGNMIAEPGLIAEVSTGPDASPSTATIDDLPVGDTARVTTEGLGLASLIETELEPGVPSGLIGRILGGLLNPVEWVVDRIIGQVLEPLLDIVDRLVVTRILHLLGLGVAGADVTAVDAICNAPKLVD